MISALKRSPMLTNNYPFLKADAFFILFLCISAWIFRSILTSHVEFLPSPTTFLQMPLFLRFADARFPDPFHAYFPSFRCLVLSFSFARFTLGGYSLCYLLIYCACSWSKSAQLTSLLDALQITEGGHPQLRIRIQRASEASFCIRLINFTRDMPFLCCVPSGLVTDVRVMKWVVQAADPYVLFFPVVVVLLISLLFTINISFSFYILHSPSQTNLWNMSISVHWRGTVGTIFTRRKNIQNNGEKMAKFSRLRSHAIGTLALLTKSLQHRVDCTSNERAGPRTQGTLL